MDLGCLPVSPRTGGHRLRPAHPTGAQRAGTAERRLLESGYAATGASSARFVDFNFFFLKAEIINQPDLRDWREGK